MRPQHPLPTKLVIRGRIKGNEALASVAVLSIFVGMGMAACQFSSLWYFGDGPRAAYLGVDNSENSDPLEIARDFRSARRNGKRIVRRARSIG